MLGKDEVTIFVGLVRTCAKNKELHGGFLLHDEILRRGLLGECFDCLVTMYTQCGALAEATKLFHKQKSRDIITWTALISGLVRRGQCPDALKYFHLMQHEGLSPDAFTFSCILKACGSIGSLEEGEKIHDQIAKQGLLVNNIVLGNALVDMYAKCGALAKAQHALEELPVRNVISWNALIGGYVQKGKAERALHCFQKMHCEGLSPDAVTFVCILKACGSMRAADKGAQIHNEINKQRLLGNDVVLDTALVDMFAKCGAMEKAHQVLEELPVQNVTAWNALIAGYIQHGKGGQAMDCFQRMRWKGPSPNRVTFLCTLKACGSLCAADEGEKIHLLILKEGLLGDNVLDTALVDMYAKCGALAKARRVLEELPARDVVSWTALISGYAEQGDGTRAVICYERMQCEGFSPDIVTYICILKACGSISAADMGEKVHDQIAKEGLLGTHIILGNALVDMYAKCGALAKSHQVLEELPVRDAVSWSALIAGYVEHGKGEQALNCYEKMKSEGLSPDAMTFTCILKAYGSIGAAKRGSQIHNELAKQGMLKNNIVLGSALVDMYAKCSALGQARQVLEELPVRDAISWNSLIAGHAQHGEGAQALSCYEQMQREGLSPDAVTFICLLKACGSIRAAEKGQEIHDEIMKQGLLRYNAVLGNALVDMYAKCGALTKARHVLEELPVQNVLMWNTLMAAYSQLDDGEHALKCVEGMQSNGISPDRVTFSCVLKTYGSIGAADKGEKIHEKIAKQGLLRNDVVLGTALVDMYAKCGALAKAQQVLEELPDRDVVSWNALITGCAQHCESTQALECFARMQSEGLSPTAATFSSVLSACSRIGLVEDGEMYFMDMSLKYGMQPDLKHQACMVDLFGRIGHFDRAAEIIERLPSFHNGVWSVLLGACKKWGVVNFGSWAFKQAVATVDKDDAAAHVCMWATAGMQRCNL